MDALELKVWTTAEVPPVVLASVRRLLDDAFEGDFTDEDWEHTLGGHHVVVVESDDVLAHAAVVPRTLDVDRRSFRCGYVEGVATARARRGEGLGRLVMSRLGELLRSEFEVGFLSTSLHPFYERLGWQRWRGPTFVRQGGELVRTEDEDAGIMALLFGPSLRLDPTSPVVCEARGGDDW